MSDPPGKAAAEALAEAIARGDRRALARVLTAVENGTAVAEPLLRRLYPLAGRAHVVGITGAPGTGKSTLVAALTTAARAAGRSVAVIAVDPSSPITGGALLGDRVRMQAHAGDPDVFIRSMASRGHAGGLAATTTAAIAVLDAAGFDLVFVETVGTGQGEVEIAASADVTVVLEAPEGGDEVQAIKAGLLEVADIVVVNKGDRPGAARTAAQLRAMLVAGRGAAEPVVAHHADLPPGTEAIGAAGDGHAGGAGATESAGRRRPEVLITTASTGAGVEDLLAAIDRRVARQHGDRSTAGRRARAEAQVWSIVLGRLRARLAAPDRVADADAILDAVARHELDPYAAADRLVGLAEGGGT